VSALPVRIEPSILSADFVNLDAEVQRIAAADAVHVDVMDNHFVPNLTFGPEMVRRLQAVSPVPLDVHLMITDADRWAPEYAEIGAFSVTFHAEASSDPLGLAARLRAAGSRAGIALKPGTPADDVITHLDSYDQVLVMTVEPGFGGQGFMDDMLDKIRAVRAAIDDAATGTWLQVDGGISTATIARAAAAGADTFVAGSSVYGSDDPAAAIATLREAAARAPGSLDSA
jgi:ribulose-phosphate 3-epimerase